MEELETVILSKVTQILKEKYFLFYVPVSF